MKVTQAYELAEHHVWERAIWVDQAWQDRAQDDDPLLDIETSPSEVYTIDEPMKLSTAAGSLW